MIGTIQTTLAALRDVNGIQGSFVVSPQGGLVARELPAIFDDTVLRDVGPRIARLYETFLSNGDEMDICSIRFADYMLYFRNVVKGFLCVLTGTGVNLPALKMAVNLAHRRISQDLSMIPDEALEQLSDPAFVQMMMAPGQYPPPVAVPAAQAQVQPTRPVRMYRGKIIE